MMKKITSGLLIAGVCLSPMLALADGDAAKGKDLFVSNCAACHADTAGAPDLQGPNLWKIYGAKPGAEAGYSYSDDFKKVNFVWDDSHLDAWLEQPAKVIPDSFMMYSQPNAQTRADIIAYLKTLK